MFFGEGGFLSVLRFLTFMWLIIKVGSINVCLLSCQFHYTYQTCKQYIDLTVEAYEEYFEILFFGGGGPSEFNYGHSL